AMVAKSAVDTVARHCGILFHHPFVKVYEVSADTTPRPDAHSPVAAIQVPDQLPAVLEVPTAVCRKKGEPERFIDVTSPVMQAGSLERVKEITSRIGSVRA